MNTRTTATLFSLSWLERRRLIHLCFILAGAALNALPRRLAFLLLVVCELSRLRGRGALARAYQPYAVALLTKHSEWRFAGTLTRRFPNAAAMVLLRIGAFREASRLIATERHCSIDMAKTAAQALFELGEFKQARDKVSSVWHPDDRRCVLALAFLKSMLEIIDGDEAAAAESIRRACRGMPILMRPHQNIAARLGSDYVPNSLDVLCGPPGRLYDLCNFAGQRVTHVGRGDIGVRLYQRALESQAELRALPPPPLSPELAQLLDQLGLSFDELRIIPEEWATQIGHLGMLDILLRMRELGWWSGRPLIVVRPNLIANSAFLRLFERFGKVLMIGKDVPDLVAEELLSLQRWCGLNFNAFALPDGSVVPWQDAGALAIAQWEHEGRGHPLRDEYDCVHDLSPEAADEFRRLREHFGMKPDDWYVCLHTRDASHYFELAGTGQTHRNSPIEAYFDAIRFITAQGGWVIKLGGPKSPKLPAFERTIDYALSDFRSELMDLCLIRNAKVFIGTTSGLTNVAISFGVPSAIVNGITTDAQLWNRNVRFSLKPVRLADGRMITQRQLTSAPWRWRVFDAAVLGRSGGHPLSNTADEILETVKEVHALAEGGSADVESEYELGVLLNRWSNSLSVPYFYGTSRPSLFYLRKYDREFLEPDESKSFGRLEGFSAAS